MSASTSTRLTRLVFFRYVKICYILLVILLGFLFESIKRKRYDIPSARVLIAWFNLGPV